MTGLSVLVRKEVSDALSNKVFLLSMSILMINMVLTGATSKQTYVEYLTHQAAIGADTGPAGLIIIDMLVPHIKFLGALVAIAYGFNAINKERAEGSLKAVLSYPIYRDQLILGKLIAGFLVVSLAVITSTASALALYLFDTNILFTSELTLRFTAFVILSILLLSGYLGFSLLFSIAFKDEKTALLATFIVAGLFNSYAFVSLGRILSDAIYGFEQTLSGTHRLIPLSPQAVVVRNLVAGLSPSYGYERIAIYLRFHSIETFVGHDYIYIPSDVWSVVMNHLNSVAVLLVIPLLTFVASYVLFIRSDVA